jgi:hypothetical protein
MIEPNARATEKPGAQTEVLLDPEPQKLISGRNLLHDDASTGDEGELQHAEGHPAKVDRAQSTSASGIPCGGL